MLLGSLLSPLLAALGLAPLLDPIVNTVDGLVGGLPIVGPLLSALDVDNTSSASAMALASDTSSPYANASSFDFMAAFGVADAEDAPTCTVEPYNPETVLDQVFPAFDIAKANIYRYRQQQSVNLGGWFVAESWITPSLFRCAAGSKASELDVASGGSPVDARAILEKHWDTFITADDFKWLASIGINTVRLPVGYWSLGPLYCEDTPFAPVAQVYENAWSRVLRAINWAGEAGVGVIIDLHGAPGNQNGRPQSGDSTGTAELFAGEKNQDKTIAILSFLVQQLAVVTNVVGIELVNEPLDSTELPAFYEKALTTLRSVSPEAASFPFYINDAYNLDRFSDFVADRDDFVVLDHHSYFVRTPVDASESAADDTQFVETSLAQTLASASAQQRRNLIIGEWSCALSNQSLANDPNPANTQQTFCQAQMETYANATAGWSFWTYLTENCEDYPSLCFKSAVGNLLPATLFSYPGVSTPSLLGVAELSTPPETEVVEPTDVPTTTTVDATPVPTSPSMKRSYQHRFMAIHERRMSLRRRDDAADAAATKAYEDGAMTVEIFFQCGMSRLGFSGQYIADSWQKMDPAVTSTGDFEKYEEHFMRGLRDGEAAIFATGAR